MASVVERVHIHRPVADVWALLTDWESQPAWMQDARSVAVTSPQRTGVGVTLHVPTDIALGLVVTDTMEVTGWQEPAADGPARGVGRIEVRHTGKVIRGHGAFEVQPTRRPDGEEGTLFTWWEQVDAPLGRFGELVAQRIAMPYVGMVFRRSLRALKAVAESRPAVPAD
jgi:carbon monoxide dehydrogenase subunit G